ncbi:hypothetical protein [Rhodococcoides fascians]|uniref:hypothetical protein n=1 Tax=Rhodococcoides fascians TaxID=1828 RepID=UPI0012D2BEFF|nr:hypothetical protein [Rhodococcus fascians]
MDEPEENGAVFAKVTLDGARFHNARLPVDALVELQRYQALVLESAKQAWFKENPGSELPDGFEDGLELTLTKVEEGSATSVLERPTTNDDLAKYYEAGRGRVEAQLRSVVEGDLDLDQEFDDLIRDLPLLATPSFQDLGSSLQPLDSLSVSKSPGDPGKPFKLTGQIRATKLVPIVEQYRLFEPRILTAPPVPEPELEPAERVEAGGQVAGRVTSVNANSSTFRFTSLMHGKVKGEYSEAVTVAMLKQYLDSDAMAPIIRLTGDLKYLGSKLIRIESVSDIDLFHIDGGPWSRRLIELASLPENWNEGLSGQTIQFSALEAARSLLQKVEELEKPEPGIFPLEDGGVQLEWSSALGVATIDISAELEFALYKFDASTDEFTDADTLNMDDAISFVKQVKI